ncbi:MAG: Serine/threonine-protein kinase PknD [Planctomycetes bacterium]|nr:Serine/threonine-protein kinase PknD [Planctomycetota bacterium]
MNAREDREPSDSYIGTRSGRDERNPERAVPVSSRWGYDARPVDNPELRALGELVICGALPQAATEQVVVRWQQFAKAGKPVSLLALAVQAGLLTRTQAYVLARTDLSAKQPFKDYRILRKIGEGGMAIVYEATYLPVKVRVALKVLDTAFSLREAYRLRFKREASILQHLDHESIVEWRDHGSADGIEFFAMGYVEGVSLQHLIDRGVRLSEAFCVHMAAQVASAIGHMGEQGVVHRDIKPGNLVVDSDGRVRIIDFGLAKLTAGMRADTGDDMTVGTLEYMSPEQARGRSDVDTRADIYSLGCSLYQMVTGELPFKGSQSEVMYAHVKTDLEWTAAAKAHCSVPLQFMIRKMMAKDPAERYQTGGELEADLRAHFAPTLSAPVPVPAEVQAEAVEAAPIPQGPPRPAAPQFPQKGMVAPQRGLVQRRGGRTPPRRGG